MDIVETLGKIGFDWRVALANLVNFLIIFWLLKRYAFKPIAAILRKRQHTINEGLDNALAAESKLEQAEAEAKGVITSARKEAQDITKGAKARGDELIAQAENEAKVRGQALLADAEALIKSQQGKAEEKIKSDAAQFVVSGLEKILKKTLTPAHQTEIIKQATAELKA